MLINLEISTAKYSTPRIASMMESDRASSEAGVIPGAPNEVKLPKL